MASFHSNGKFVVWIKNIDLFLCFSALLCTAGVDTHWWSAFPNSLANWLLSNDLVNGRHWGKQERKKLAHFSISTSALGGICQPAPFSEVSIPTEQSLLLGSANVLFPLHSSSHRADRGFLCCSAVNLWGASCFPIWPFSPSNIFNKILS